MTGRKVSPVGQVSYRLTFLHKHIVCCPSSSEKIQALHTELDSVQALRSQLEEVLSRTRNMALLLDRAAKPQPDFGGGGVRRGHSLMQHDFSV